MKHFYQFVRNFESSNVIPLIRKISEKISNKREQKMKQSKICLKNYELTFKFQNLFLSRLFILAQKCKKKCSKVNLGKTFFIKLGQKYENSSSSKLM